MAHFAKVVNGIVEQVIVAEQEFIDNLFTSQDINYVFKPNNFPYAVDDNIIHYVLWIRPGLIINGTLLNTVIFRHIKLIFKPNPKYSFIKKLITKVHRNFFFLIL